MNLTQALAADMTNYGVRVTDDAVDFGAGRAMAWRPPITLEPDHPAGARAAQIVRRLAEHTVERGKIMGDERRSDLAKQQDGAAVDAKATAALNAALQEAEKWADAAEQTYAAALAPPVIRPEDASGAIADQEVRSHLRSLDLASAIVLVRDHEAVANAVLRSPLPQPEQLVEFAKAHRAQLLAANANGASIAAGADLAAWLRQVARQGRSAFEQVVKPARPTMRSVA
jgi:hypothetical protein